jgi:hypothetical protein
LVIPRKNTVVSTVAGVWEPTASNESAAVIAVNLPVWLSDHCTFEAGAPFAAGAETERTHALLACTLRARPVIDGASLSFTAAGTDPDIALTLTLTLAGTVTETTWVRLLTPALLCPAAGRETRAPTIITANQSDRI